MLPPAFLSCSLSHAHTLTHTHTHTPHTHTHTHTPSLALAAPQPCTAVAKSVGPRCPGLALPGCTLPAAPMHRPGAHPAPPCPLHPSFYGRGLCPGGRQKAHSGASQESRGAVSMWAQERNRKPAQSSGLLSGKVLMGRRENSEAEPGAGIEGARPYGEPHSPCSNLPRWAPPYSCMEAQDLGKQVSRAKPSALARGGKDWAAPSPPRAPAHLHCRSLRRLACEGYPGAPTTWGLWLRTLGLALGGPLEACAGGQGQGCLPCMAGPHSPSSRSFRAAASRRATLGGKRTRFCGRPSATSFCDCVRRPLLPWASFSAWAHIFTCWARRFWACFSRSCVLILPTVGISASSSRCSAMAGAACQGGCWGHRTGKRGGQAGPARRGSWLDWRPGGHPLSKAQCPLPLARLGQEAPRCDQTRAAMRGPGPRQKGQQGRAPAAGLPGPWHLGCSMDKASLPRPGPGQPQFRV